MTAIRISEFGGMIPKLDDKALPPNCAVDAINVDLQGQGILPVYAPTLKRLHGAGLPEYEPASIHQTFTACLKVASLQLNVGYAVQAPDSGNYTVVANDQLVYAVYLPDDVAAVAGQGAINLHFTSGATLGNINDQNAIGSFTGDISSQAFGKWYVRVITLASVVGLTIDEVRLYHNHAAADMRVAYFGTAFVRSSATGAVRAVLFDPESQNDPPITAGGSLTEHFLTTICEDEHVVVNDNPGNYKPGQSCVVIPVEFSGSPKGKEIVIRSSQPGNKPVSGRSNHDKFLSYDPAVTNPPQSARAYTLTDRHEWVGSNWAWGWVFVDEALSTGSILVVGGAPPVVTRSYCYTLVSPDGLEGPPSEPQTQTGNRDGTWQFQMTAPAPNDSFNHVRNPQVKRIYRTPEGSATFRFVAEVANTVTTLNDLALDEALGEALATAHYSYVPALRHGAGWINGLVGAITYEQTQAVFCEPYLYHAWPERNRYTLPAPGVACGAFGDRFVVLTARKPVVFTGNLPEELQWQELQNGEPCISDRGVITADPGVLYPGRTGWWLVNYEGAQNITKEFLSGKNYNDIVDTDTTALFDNRRLVWIKRRQTQGYSFEFGAGPRSLTKFELPEEVHALHYFAPLDIRWAATYGVSGQAMQKLFDDTTQPLKWTWKSKLLRLKGPERLKVAKVDSSEWLSLSNNMRYREGFYKTIPAWVTGTAYAIGDFVTQGGNTYRCDVAHVAGVFAADLAALKWILTNTIYSISTAGLIQAENWVYLKVWAEADKDTDKVLVFDDFVVSDKPVRFARVMKSDCWQFELRGNMALSAIEMARSERELGRD
jgi:hypothetical protein